MEPKIEVLAGIAGSGKTTELLSLYRDALRAGLARSHPGTTLWLAPTNRAQAGVRDRLFDGSLPVVFRPNLATFDGFADQILAAAPQAVVPLSQAMQRILLRRIVADLVRRKRLPHFERIAGTSGFLDLVSAFISELKRGETWPEHFTEACAKRGMRPRDGELGLIYARYQEALVAAGVYDGEGRFWSAREALAAGHWGRFADVSFVVVDGFTDFTEAQYRILELLARKADRLLVSLITETPLVRKDLFAKSEGVIARLKAGAEVCVRACRPAEAPRAIEGAPPPAAFDHLARHLFANPRETPAAHDAQGIDVVAVAGQAGEASLLATRIKQLLLAGVVPGDIVVAIRDLDGYAGLIDEVFGAAGIPFACEAGTPLARLAPFIALANVLAMELEDWPFRRLMGLLDSGLFRPAWEEFAGGEAARAVAAELRWGELDGGRERILAGIEHSARRAVAGDHSQAAVDSPNRERAGRALTLLRKLSETTGGLRRAHSLEGWSAVVATLVRDLGFDRAPLDDASSGTGRGFGETLAAILFDAARAERVTGAEPVPLTLAEFLRELTDLFERQRLPPRLREEGRVRVLSAEQVRNLDIPYLFLAGLTETSFPQHRRDDCLYGEGERQELNRHGLALGHRTLRAQEELLMFYGIVTRARRRLVLTYPVVTAEGQPLSPSPYLSGLKELFDPQALKTALDERLDPVPDADRLLSGGDARVRGMSEALAGRPGLFRAVCEDPRLAAAGRNCLAAVEMNVGRFHTAGFTRFEGWLENPRNIEQLRQRFSPEHEFSATQLEAYARCPFRFLLSQVLAVEPPPSPDIETDFGRRGTLVHDVLADLHRKLFDDREAAGGPQNASRGEDVSTMFQKLLEEKLKERAPASRVHEALQRIEQRLLAEWGIAYGRQWDEYVAGLPRDADAPPLPARFETPFGSMPPGAEPAAGEPKPLVIGTGDNSVRVGGRIDRIDVGRIGGSTVFAIIDYKTGSRRKSPHDTVESGRWLQVVLYALAVVRLELIGAGARPWQMGYWHVRETGFAPDVKQGRPKAGDPLPPLDQAVWESLVETLENIIPRLAAGIRAGQFPVFNADENCTAGCPYNTVCRVAQIRALPPEMGKSWSP
ncbi:MAG: PD-(D/E)XK nuclease family protein [Deltaproteobacteria bacterium]